MKIMFRAAIAALSFASIGPAIAGEGSQSRGGYVFPDYQIPTTPAPSVATAQSGQAIHAYVTRSSRGTWLSQPNQNEGANN